MDPNTIHYYPDENETPDSLNMNLLSILIEEENIFLIDFFLFESDKKVDPNVVDQITKFTPLSAAIQTGNL